MKKKEILSIIIPCFNESEGIQQLDNKLTPVLNELENKFEIDLIFIDDGSTDDTFELLNKHFGSRGDTKIIKHKKNMNLGPSIRTGLKIAKGDLIMMSDSDCTYEPSEMIKMLELLTNDVDIVRSEESRVGKECRSRWSP